MLLIVGIVASILTGVALPVLIILFGDLMESMLIPLQGAPEYTAGTNSTTQVVQIEDCESVHLTIPLWRVSLDLIHDTQILNAHLVQCVKAYTVEKFLTRPAIRNKFHETNIWIMSDVGLNGYFHQSFWTRTDMNSGWIQDEQFFPTYTGCSPRRKWPLIVPKPNAHGVFLNHFYRV